MEFTEGSLRNSRGKWPEIKWAQVEQVTFTDSGSYQFIVFHLRSDFPASVKLDSNGTTSFGFVGLKSSAAEAKAWLQENKQHFFTSNE